MSRRHVARYLGVTPSTLHKWEHGHVRMFPATLVDLADLFGVPISAFFPGGLPFGRLARHKLRRGQLRQIARFVATVRSIPSGELQETMVCVTALVREGQSTTSEAAPELTRHD